MTDSNIPVFRAQLRYNTVDDFIDGYSQFVLPGKMFVPLEASQLKPVDSRVRFEFRLADGTRALVGEGVVEEVRGRDHAGDGPTGLVVRYTHLSQRSKQLIGQIVDKQRAESRAGQQVDADGTESTSSGEPDAVPNEPGRPEEPEPGPEAGAPPPEADAALEREPRPTPAGDPEFDRNIENDSSGIGTEPNESSSLDEQTQPGESNPEIGAEEAGDIDETIPPEEPLDSPPPEAVPDAGRQPDPTDGTDGDLDDLGFGLDEEPDEGTESSEIDDREEGFEGFEAVEESESSGEGFQQLGETEAGLQVMAYDEEGASEEGAESFAEFQEGDEGEDVDELFDGVFQDDAAGDADGGMFGGGDDGEGGDLFGEPEGSPESAEDLLGGGANDAAAGGDAGLGLEADGSEAGGSEAVDESRASEPPNDEVTTAEGAEPVEPAGEAEAGLGEISSAIEEELDEEPRPEANFDQGASSLDADSFSEVDDHGDDGESERNSTAPAGYESPADLETGELEEPTPAPTAAPESDVDSDLGELSPSSDARASADDSPVDEAEAFDSSMNLEGGPEASSDAHPDDESAEPGEVPTEPAGQDAIPVEEDPVSASEGNEDIDPDLPEDEPTGEAGLDELDELGDEPSPASPDRGGEVADDEERRFTGASSDSDELDDALDSLEEEGSSSDSKDLTLSVGSQSDAEPEPPADDEQNSESLEALVADAQDDIEQKQDDDEEEDGDALDEVLGEDLPTPPEDDFDFDVSNSGPSFEPSTDPDEADDDADLADSDEADTENQPPTETDEADDDSKKEQVLSDDEDDEEDSSGGMLSGLFGGNS